MNRTVRWHGAALALFVVVAGCQEDELLRPDLQLAIEESADATTDVSRVARYRTGSPSASASAAAWIGAEGGTLRLLDFEVVVPAGAVSVPTRFRIRVPADPKKLNRVMAEFEPHNTPFEQPVTLIMPYRGTSAEGSGTAVIWWSGSAWVRYPTTLRQDGRLETTTDHFSFYGTEDNPFASPGIIPIGG